MDAMNYEALLKHKNLKSTKHRQSVLEILARHNQPVSPEEILGLLHEMGISISVSTVYRILEKLTEKGIILKTGMTEDRKGLYELRPTEHKHHLICIKCRKTLPIGECPFKDYERDIEDRFGFDITDHKLELYGYCRSCKNEDNPSDQA